ncbi:hypothetical protein JCM8547_004865 [Rhodosporidiobolus lusitaniae]
MDKQDRQPASVDDLSLSLADLSLEPKKVDYLSRLPPELLRTIFKEVYSELPRPGLPLNRALAPFHDEFAHNATSVDCYDCLTGFMHNITTFPRLGPFLKILVIEFELDEDGDPAKESPALRNRMMTVFFSTTPNLKILVCTGGDVVLSLLLRPTFASKHLQKLEHLSATGAFLDFPHPLHPSNFAALGKYPSLVAFAFTVAKTRPFRRLSSLPPITSAKHFSNLTSLSFEGPRLNSRYLQAILAGCEHLIDLDLIDGGGKVDLVKLLDHLPSPDLLKNLGLQSFP